LQFNVPPFHSSLKEIIIEKRCDFRLRGFYTTPSFLSPRLRSGIEIDPPTIRSRGPREINVLSKTLLYKSDKEPVPIWVTPTSPRGKSISHPPLFVPIIFVLNHRVMRGGL